MGAFFTNVHVLAPEGQEAPVRERILEALIERAKGEGFVSCEEGAGPDRTIIVGPPARWIGVYDQATETQQVELLDALAQQLSRVTNGNAAGILVHDSDELHMRLFTNGESVDRVVIGRKKKTGKAERWSSAVTGADAAALREAFGANDLLVEQTLESIARALGMSTVGATTGCKYLLEDGRLPEGSATLRLRHAVRPAYEEPASGPPRLASIHVPIECDLSAGEEMHLNAQIRNEGGASRGLIVGVHGAAVEGQLIEPVRVTIDTGRLDARTSYEQSFVFKTLPNGLRVFLADFPDLAIPAGNAGGWAALAGVDAEKMIAIQHSSQLRVNVHGRALAAGAAMAVVTCAAHRAPEKEAHSIFELSIGRTPRRPLRATGSALECAALETQESIVAYAVSTLVRGDAAAIAATTIERFSELWPGGAKLSGHIRDDSDVSRPTKGRSFTLKVDGLVRSAAWKKARAALSVARQVSARRDAKEEVSLRKRLRCGDGFAFGGAMFAPNDSKDPELPTLRLGVHLLGRDDAGAVLERAIALVGEFAERAKCAQAFVARWRSEWGVLDSNAFERIYGAQGVPVFRRSWATRFLRGISADAMWLGPELMGRIDRVALERVAKVEPVGDLCRVVLREDSSMDRLEEVLEPLLPSREAWERWTRWMYGHAKEVPWSS